MKKGIRHIELVNSRIEFDEFDFDDNLLGTRDEVRGLERRRVGVRFAIGERPAKAYFQVFGETLDETRRFELGNGQLAGGDLDGGGGIGGGVEGDAIIERAGDVAFLLPYRVGLNLVGLDNELTDVSYSEVELEFGFGVDVFGARVAAGLYHSSIWGVFDDDSIGGRDGDLYAGNGGAFFEAGYKHRDVPFYFKLRAMDGDAEQSALLVVGATF